MADAMHYQLAMMHDNRPVRTIPLKPGDTIIGRTKGCKIRISAHEISRKHCRLRVTGDAVYVKDLGSANGTRVNGNPVTGEYLLQHADRLVVGPVTFVLERRTGPQPADAMKVDVVEISEEMTAVFPNTSKKPATLPNTDAITFVDYPREEVPPPSPAAPAPLPVAELDDDSMLGVIPSATPPPSAAPPVTLGPEPAGVAPAEPVMDVAAVEVTAAVEENLPFADLDDEQPPGQDPAKEAAAKRIEWLLSDEAQ